MEIRNHRITKRGKIFGSAVIGVLLILFFALVIIEINDLVFEHNYVSSKYAVITGDLWRISPQIAGEISQIKVKPGEVVKKGDLVLVMNEEQLKAQLNEAALTLGAAKTQLKEALKGASRDEVEASKVQIRRARVVYAGAKTTSDSLNSSLYSIKKTLKQVVIQMKPYINPVTKKLDENYALKALKSSYANNPGQAAEYLVKANALQQLFSLKAQLELEIIQFKAQLNSIIASETNAKTELVDAQNRFTKLKAGPSAIELSLLNNMVKAAQAEYGFNKLTLDYSKIRAPHSGTVIDTYGHKGEVISSGTTAITLMDFSKLYATVYISQQDLHRVKLGQKVDLMLFTDKKHSIKGIVSQIGKATMGVFRLITDNNNISVKNELNARIPIKVDISDSDIKIMPGMALSAKIRVTK